MIAERNTSSPPGWIIPVLALGTVFIIVAVQRALAKDILVGFDELAHVSYLAFTQVTGAWLPDLDRVTTLAPQTLTATPDPTYLNHPAIYYRLLGLVVPDVTSNPGALLAARLVNVALAALGVFACLAIAPLERLRQGEAWALAAPICLIPVLPPLAGSVNNDNLAFAAGALSVAAALRWLHSGRHSWAVLAVAAAALGGAVKLTALMLSGGFLLALVATTTAWPKLPRRAWIMILALGAATLVPYVHFVIAYGSPAPDTAAQHALLVEGAAKAGWATGARLEPVKYVAWFVAEFIRTWMPTPLPRSPLNLAMLAVPAASVLLALAGLALSLRARLRHNAEPLDLVIIAGWAAILVTLAVHMVFSYGRHLDTGWMMDAYPRYYLPLAVIMPLAALRLARGLSVWPARAVLTFQAASPLAFLLLGVPRS